MKRDLCLPDKDRIAREILAYLSKHPAAEDTLEGIVQWWLLERKITYQIGQVKEALDALVAKGLILKHKAQRSHNNYRINKEKGDEIQAIIVQGKDV